MEHGGKLGHLARFHFQGVKDYSACLQTERDIAYRLTIGIGKGE